jgi:hypothetical protein
VLGDDGREVASRAVTTDGDAVGVDAHAGGVGVHPRPRGQHVVEGRRERRLGRQPVVDRHDPHLGLLGELAADGVMAVEAAVHEAATMDVHERR